MKLLHKIGRSVPLLAFLLVTSALQVALSQKTNQVQDQSMGWTTTVTPEIRSAEEKMRTMTGGYDFDINRTDRSEVIEPSAFDSDQEVAGWNTVGSGSCEGDELTKLMKLTEEHKKKSECGPDEHVHPEAKKLIDRMNDIDLGYEARVKVLCRDERRWKGACLRAIKHGLCDVAPNSDIAMNTKGGSPKECNGKYYQVEHAKDFPKVLHSDPRRKYQNVYCPQHQQALTPAEIPLGSIICYEPIKRPGDPGVEIVEKTINKKKRIGVKYKHEGNVVQDFFHESGHCEVKGCQNRYCYDGCRTGPRIRGQHSDFNLAVNRKISAVLVHSGMRQRLKPCDPVQPSTATKPAKPIEAAPQTSNELPIGIR